MNTNDLLLRQTSDKLSVYKGLSHLARPSKGWIRVIREALGMTTSQLAQRLGITQSSVVRFEQAEVNDAITLKSLKTIAEALDCELVYAIIPKSSLEKTIEEQAKKIAKIKVDEVAHNMSLEDKKPTQKQVNEIYQQLLEQLKKKRKNLWK